MLIRSATDAEFRRKLVESPAEALAEFTGTAASHFAHLNIAFVENRNAATIVLPDAVPAGELSESELQARRSAWQPRPTQYPSGALWRYAQTVGPAEKGAVTHPGAKAGIEQFFAACG